MTKSEYNARKLKIIKEIYNEIIENYAELNRVLEFKNPVEVYSLYTKLLHKGFFSKNGHFSYNENLEMLDFYNFLGLDVINGNGVCRHFCSMLKDIYDKLQFNNEIMLVHFYELNDDVKKQHFRGNHTINLVEDKGISYYLDPSNSFIWDKVSKNIFVTYKNRNIEVASFSYFFSCYFAFHNCKNFQLKNAKNIGYLMEYSSSNFSDCLKLDDKVNKIYKNNLDIFESLERENRVLYNEIDHNLSKMKLKRK